jgi:nitrogenase molybdenum-iron protein NifN
MWPACGDRSASAFLSREYGVPVVCTAPPIGIRATDRFMESLALLCGNAVPARYREERGRLLDAYVDGHKYLSQKRALLFGDEPMVVAMAGFCSEIGIVPVVCGTGGRSAAFSEVIGAATEGAPGITICQSATTDSLVEPAQRAGVELVIGSSKGLRLAESLGVPLVRIGFPIHDRFGAARLLHVGYRGTQQLLDRIINACITHAQQTDEVAYAYY